MKNYLDPNQPEMHAIRNCPTCRNDNVDTLIWDEKMDPDSSFVTCLNCGTYYQPATGKIESKPEAN